MLLNFGHTFGHAIEHLTDYERYTHGEAVALGMIVAAKVGVQLGVTPADVVERLIDCLDRYALPTSVPSFAVDQWMHAMLADKRLANELHLILLRAVGEAVICPVHADELMSALSGCSVRSAVCDIGSAPSRRKRSFCRQC